MEHLKNREIHPTVFSPDLRFAARNRTGLEVAGEVKDHSDHCQLICLKGNATEPHHFQCAVIAYLN